MQNGALRRGRGPPRRGPRSPSLKAPTTRKARVSLGPSAPHRGMIQKLLIAVTLTLTVAASITAQRRATMNSKTVDPQIAEIKRLVEELDVKYQAAVKNNDAETMSTLLSDDFILVTGKGRVFTKNDLLDEARRKTTKYERQEDSERTVRVWGNTAIITALLWEKGTTSDGKAFDKKLWFSDVYKLTPKGWKYVFAQASIPL